MIYDHIENLNSYLPTELTKKIRLFLEGIPEEDQITNIEGEDLFAVTSTYNGKSFKEAQYESHFKYIDLQIMITGDEELYYHPVMELTEETRNDENDICFYKKSEVGIPLHLTNTMFALLYPQDGHMPCIRKNTDSQVRKVVFKIKTSLLD